MCVQNVEMRLMRELKKTGSQMFLYSKLIVHLVYHMKLVYKKMYKYLTCIRIDNI